MRRLGLIGGLGPAATVHYYRKLATAQAGEMILVHADVERVLTEVEQGNRAGLASYFGRLIERLAAGGAEVAAISAIAPHICIRELEARAVLPLVNAVSEIAKEIRARGYQKVALFGTRFVMESRLFGMLGDIEVVVPEQVETIHRTYLQIVQGGMEGRNLLSEIARELPVDATLLAGTDLSVIFDKGNTPFPHIDCAQVHIEAIVRALQ